MNYLTRAMLQQNVQSYMLYIKNELPAFSTPEIARFIDREKIFDLLEKIRAYYE